MILSKGKKLVLSAFSLEYTKEADMSIYCPLSSLIKRKILVGEGGFEPPKSSTTDLQSAPFGRSGTLPYYKAGGRT